MPPASDPQSSSPPANSPPDPPANSPPASLPDPLSSPPQSPPPGRERLATWRLIAAIALPVAAIIAVVIGAAIIGSRPVSTADDPLVVSSVEAPGATTAACSDLMAALPDPLGQLPRRELVQGADPLLAGVAAWGEPAVVLRCGTPTPNELTCSASIQVVDGVGWLPLYGAGVTTYLAVDRPVRVALTIPDGSSTGPWQEMSRVIGATMEQRSICVNGVVTPPDAG